MITRWMPKIARGFALLLLTISGPASADCMTAALSCNTTVDREISADDCVAADQSRYDLYRIHGEQGQYMEVTLAPLDVSLTMPSLQLLAPGGDSADTPFIGGGGTPRFRYILTSAGDWTLVVGTMRTSDAGRYRLALRCQASATTIPSDQWHVLKQPFSCGQIARWRLDPSNFEFSDGGVFAYYVIDFTPGTPMQFRLHSDDFDPRLGIYNLGVTLHPLMRGIGTQYVVDARIAYTVPAPADPGTYFVAASAANGQASGAFTLYGDCAAPPACVPPVITAAPQSATIVPGGSITLGVTISGSGPFTYEWHYSNDPLPIGSSPTLKVASPARTTSYSVIVTNACGIATSAAAVITVKPPRERGVRH